MNGNRNNGISGHAFGKLALLRCGGESLNVAALVTDIGDTRELIFGGHWIRVEMKPSACSGKQIIVEPKKDTPFACATNPSLSVWTLMFRPNMARELPGRSTEEVDSNDWVMIQSDRRVSSGSSGSGETRRSATPVATVH